MLVQRTSCSRDLATYQRRNSGKRRHHLGSTLLTTRHLFHLLLIKDQEHTVLRKLRTQHTIATMATQAMPGRSRDVHHGASNSISHSYPPLPGSPTLTNPDMILPDYDDDDDNHSDSPGARSRSPLTMWQNTQATATSFHLPQQESFVAGPTGITSPTTPIIYGNGTMLSDIGEVTEVESSVGVGVRRAPSLYSDQSDDEGMIQAATAIGGKGVAKKLQVMTRERRGSAESTSTITTQQEARGAFAEFDDSMSMDDSNFQGDDEESVADSFADDGAYGETPANRHNIQTAGSDKFSTNSISKRAEQILANAKRRLTVRHHATMQPSYDVEVC